jgi:hypothetical protein
MAGQPLTGTFVCLLSIPLLVEGAQQDVEFLLAEHKTSDVVALSRKGTSRRHSLNGNWFDTGMPRAWWICYRFFAAALAVALVSEQGQSAASKATQAVCAYGQGPGFGFGRG